VALLRLLVAGGFRKLVVCHLDHGLRGRAGAGDARFVGRLAAEFGLPLETKRVRVAELARTTRESIETAGRRARHAFFAECAAKHRCRRVMLAHHADDQAETVLWNLLRGSHGLQGIKPVQRIIVPDGGELEIHRPLLEIRRAELRTWLAAHGWEWREDGTNREPVTARNRLRLEALPLLNDIAGREVAELLVRAALADDDARQVADWALAQARVSDPQGRLHVRVLRALPAALQRAALARYLADRGVGGVTRDLLDRARAMLESDGPAKLNLPGGMWLRRREARLVVWHG
jgi:tRNA(Ile)-lysidine synthase